MKRWGVREAGNWHWLNYLQGLNDLSSEVEARQDTLRGIAILSVHDHRHRSVQYAVLAILPV